MSSIYGTIETAIVDAIEDAVGQPFTTVRAIGSQLSNEDLAREIDNLATVAPAVLVLYRGGDDDPGHAGWGVENARFALVMVAAGRTPEAALRGDAAGVGVYELIDWLIENLNNADISGVPNRLRFRQSMPLPRDLPITIAAWMVVFETQIRRRD